MIKYLAFIPLLLLACTKPEPEPIILGEDTFIRGADLSDLPKIESLDNVFFNRDGQAGDMLSILKDNGVNTIRVKLWYSSPDGHAGFQEVKAFSERIKAKGLKVWLTVHYSDTWADPGNQAKPGSWLGLDYNTLKDSMYAYTARIVSEIHPEFIQIGNEINSGFLWPHGHNINNEAQFIELLSTGAKAVRDNDDEAKIIIHFAGLSGSNWFFNKVVDVDYDIMGLSYYPFYHGQDLGEFESTLSSLGETYDKDILIAETAYPFTLEWEDWTTNIVGSEEDLITPDYPATPTGQKAFVAKIKEIVTQADRGIGFCYWGSELVAFDGNESTEGSPWENLALFGFDNKALPVVEAFVRE
jgi:arabinogalactan endo-1,4-beta-galactosidase